MSDALVLSMAGKILASMSGTGANSNQVAVDKARQILTEFTDLNLPSRMTADHNRQAIVETAARMFAVQVASLRATAVAEIPVSKSLKRAIELAKKTLATT